jgi:hypothetical protein
VLAAQSGRPLAGIEVIAHRRDRSFDQIVALSREIDLQIRSEQVYQALRPHGDTAMVMLTMGLPRSEVERLVRHYQTAHVQLRLGQGRDTSDVADELAISRIELLRLNAQPAALSADAQAMLAGDFVYYVTVTESDGFAFFSLPREQAVTFTIRHQAYRDFTATVVTAGNAVSQRLGDFRVFSR